MVRLVLAKVTPWLATARTRVLCQWLWMRFSIGLPKIPILSRSMKSHSRCLKSTWKRSRTCCRRIRASSLLAVSRSEKTRKWASMSKGSLRYQSTLTMQFQKKWIRAKLRDRLDKHKWMPHPVELTQSSLLSSNRFTRMMPKSLKSSHKSIWSILLDLRSKDRPVHQVRDSRRAVPSTKVWPHLV